AGLTFSMLFRPRVAASQRALLTLLVASATARAMSERANVDVAVKWPNDLLVGEEKVGGILAEAVEDAVVVGVGINVSTRTTELPDSATSLAIVASDVVDRGPLLLAVLRAVGRDYVAWVDGGGGADAVLPAYRERCATLGREVRIELPDATSVHGSATDVDELGRLLVDGRAYSAGDVVHLRMA
ncbi:MAG: biotin--[acetyl-CoA-carboxylase] ligase, partial [Frankia sp.]|nr:biotin--[acetyl-CoA-carboxylase] ligase [Frankia sp.]